MDTPEVRPMTQHTPEPSEAEVCVTELKDALALHGITLPSIGVDLDTFSRFCQPPELAGLVSLGRCNVGTARLLARTLRAAAG